jgi:hypothetical protein
MGFIQCKIKHNLTYLPAGGRALWPEGHAHKCGFATPYCVGGRKAYLGFVAEARSEKTQVCFARDSQNGLWPEEG